VSERLKCRVAGFSVLVLVAVQLLIVFAVAPSTGTNSVVKEQGTQLPGVSIIKLWSVTHASYMAKFYGENYVVVCDSHCDVSLNGGFISTYGAAYVYKTTTGVRLGSLSGPGTWRVDSWEPFSATKVSSYSGFFSADSSKMVMDPRMHGGTGAVVYDTSTWRAIQIDWGFTDTTGSHFYAIQLDYDGDTLAVGYIGVDYPNSGWNDTSRLLIYKYDPGQGKYVKVYQYSAIGDYGRRLQMTLDGRVVLVGGMGHPYIDIHAYDGNSYTLKKGVGLPDVGGVTALGISDSYNVGYVIAGTLNGWVIIGKYDISTNEFIIIYQNQDAPINSWLYSPFYDRWIPKVTEVFALCTHRDSNRVGRGIVFDVLTNKTKIIDFAGAGTPQWSAATVSPEANYIFLGESLYMVVKRDVQTGAPRARLWGTLITDIPYQPLNVPIMVSAPGGIDALFFSGNVTISRLYVEPVSVGLVDDPDILAGYLSKMHGKGLIYPEVFHVDAEQWWSYTDVGALDILPGVVFKDELASEGLEDYENFIAQTASLKFKPPPYFREGNIYYGTVINVPLSQPLGLYSEMKMELATSIHQTALLYDVNGRALGVLGVPTTVGGGVAASSAVVSKVANAVLAKWVIQYLRGAIDVSKLAGLTTVQSAAKVAGYVGLAIIAWGGVDAVLIKWGGFGAINAQTWLIIAPTVVDKYGRQFTALKLYLPLEESVRVQDYYNIISEHFSKLGYADVGLEVDYPVRTWDEYKRLLERGFTPVVDLYKLISETIASKYGLRMEELKITGCKILVVNRVWSKETFWEWIGGGVSAAAVTLIGAKAINVKGVLASKILTDPSDIVSALGSIYINDNSFTLQPGRDGAYASFNVLLGTSKLVLKFNAPAGYYGDLRLAIDSVVKAPFSELNTYGYTARLDYNWTGTQLALSKIDLVDMPYPMLICERIYMYTYGNFTQDLTKYFNMTSVTDDPSSPSGKRYYYVTTSTLIFDPANGGLLQPGEKFILNYYYNMPPDVSIMAFLNGTQLASTLPHHVTVVINNSAPPQDVFYDLTITLKYYRDTTEVIAGKRTFAGLAARVGNYSVFYDTFSIAEDVYEAIELMKTLGVVVQMEIYARITNAAYNYYKSNDEWRLVYIPSPQLPTPIPSGNFTVTVYVYEFHENKWVPSPNATVEIYRGYNVTGERVYAGVTNESGVVQLIMESGTYTFRASKPGFIDYNVTLLVASNTVVNMYLAPAEKPPIITPVPTNVTVTFYVYNATSGSPVSGANITATYIEPANSTYYNAVFTATTGSDGKAVLVLPVGKYIVNVSATGYNAFTGYYVFDRDTVVNIPLTPTGVTPPTYYALIVQVFYADGKPYAGANVTVANNATVSLKTDTYGTALFILESNLEYSVTASVSEPLYNRSYSETRKVFLNNDTKLVFTVPWNSTQPPIIINQTPYYWLGVQTLWANGLPFQGADVKAYNYTTGELVACMSTNGTGVAWFLLPAFQVYMVNVTAVNPYNTSQVFTDVYIVNLTENIVLTIRLPWSPGQPEYAQVYRVVVYAYDSLNGTGVPDVVVIARRGDLFWSNKTNSTGYADLYVPYTGYYNITGVHPNYMVVWREIVIVENNTLVNLPLVPVVTNITPPINGTYPPVVINGTSYYWLTVQALWSDGYPFEGAVVKVYDNSTGALIASGVTNGTGAVNFLIKANTTIKYTINATNPSDATQTYYAERVLNMTQHYWFIHVLPWTSKYFAPEVAVSYVELVIHRGQGYFYGNVSHAVYFRIWTNVRQNVTVFIGVYNVTEGTPVLVNNKTVNLTLDVGVNAFFEWISVNASTGGFFRAFVNITSYQNDTILENNYMWSDIVYLKPFTDFYVVILWRPYQVKQSWTLLPEDIVELDIGVYSPVNTTLLPAVFRWRIEFLNVSTGKRESIRSVEEELRVGKPGMVWRNMTVIVPWTSKIYANVSVDHPWEDVVLNNNLTIEIAIDPDIALLLVDYTKVVNEGGEIRVVVHLKSNIEPNVTSCWVSIEDNTTNKILVRKSIPVEPEKTIELKANAPDNPPLFWIVRKPSTNHSIGVVVVGNDLYTENNYAPLSVLVVSNQWITVVIAVAVLIAVIVAISAIIRATRHAIEEIEDEHRLFVKRKRFVYRK